MSAAAPSSADDKMNEPKPKPGGLLKFMSKENTVVSASQLDRKRVMQQHQQQQQSTAVVIARKVVGETANVRHQLL